jgi:hypothetical protein
MKKYIAGFGIAIVAFFAVPTAAQAHTPAITVDCSGVVLHAENYDGNVANNWYVTINDETQQGTFGAKLDKTFAVPQDGATSTVKVLIEDVNGTPEFSKTFDGSVGPCGEVKVPEKPDNIPWGDSSANTPNCETRIVTDTVREGYYDHTLVNNVWVKNEQPTVTKDETKTRTVTEEECPTPVTPTPTPTKTTPADTPETDAPVADEDDEQQGLAVTGPFDGPLPLYAGGLVMLGIAAMTLRRILA